MNHIQLSMGNIIVMGGISVLAVVGTLAAIHVLSNKDVPVLSPAARGAADFVKGVAA